MRRDYHGILMNGMDALFKNMDFSVNHWSPYPRLHPSTHPLMGCKLMRNKDHWVRHSFNTCNFSLILEGHGEFRRQGRIWKVESPCVITQWPGEWVEYGPPKEETWSELYFIYEASLFKQFRHSKLIDLNVPVWPIRDLSFLIPLIQELAALCRNPTPSSVADRVDRVAERIILETWMGDRSEKKRDATMVLIANQIAASPTLEWNFEKIARKYGLSNSTFRRRWSESLPYSPARYVIHLRIREACQKLAEGTEPVNQIARSVGFEDEFYFSRCFKREQGISPREYRRIYRENGF